MDQLQTGHRTGLGVRDLNWGPSSPVHTHHVTLTMSHSHMTMWPSCLKSKNSGVVPAIYTITAVGSSEKPGVRGLHRLHSPDHKRTNGMAALLSLLPSLLLHFYDD